MRKLILEEWMTLDGYVTDKDNQLNFFTDITPEENAFADKEQLAFLETIDTILLGRKTYELFAGFWPTATTDKEIIADKLNETRKIVFSNTLEEAPWGHWEPASVMAGDAIAAIRKLKSEPGKDMVMWGSISLAQALMQKNLIDEYRIQLCPVIAGGGRRLFAEETDFNKLVLKATRKYDTGIVFLNYSLSR